MNYFFSRFRYNVAYVTYYITKVYDQPKGGGILRKKTDLSCASPKKRCFDLNYESKPKVD